METLFLVGSFWFWTLLTVAFTALSVFTEKGLVWWGTFTALATALLLQFYGNLHFFTWAYKHPKELILWGLAYLAIGMLYSVLKWSLFINKKAKADIRNSVHAPAPMVEYHAARIIGWMEFWPIGLIWNVINDPIRFAFETIFEKTKGLFQSIANSAYERASKQK